MLCPLVLLTVLLSPGLDAQKPSIEPSYDLEIQEMVEGAEKSVAQILKDNEFQEFVEASQKNALLEIVGQEDSMKKSNQGELYVFVSFSLGIKSLISIALQAKRFGATLVLKGLKEGSYQKTLQAIQPMIEKTEQGLIVDPELFEEFHVEVVPTIILTERLHAHEDGRSTPVHDRMSGNVTLNYALEKFEKEGQMRAVAKRYLKQGVGQ